jgi:nitroimidazol reductase NimA-like FMN-containing flavoprotein (pyridoxamine 5'-phosphate oxidase superfamily)
MTTLAKTPRTTHRRNPGRGSHDRALLDGIFDEALVAHVGIVVDGEPLVVPMVFARIGDELYLHGARASRLLRAVAEGTPVAITATLVDGLVFAKSAFHHSMNYRSAMVFGTGREATDVETKRRVFDALIEKSSPGRSAFARPASEHELAATLVVALPIVEGSAKVRTGGPRDDEEDVARAAWSGHVPLVVAAGAPVADGNAGASAPPALPSFVRRG